MPWVTIKHGNKSIPKNVENYEVKCIPTLIILNNQGQLVSSLGRVDIMVDEYKAWDKWLQIDEQITKGAQEK